MNNYQLGCVCYLNAQLCDGRCRSDARARTEMTAHVGYPMRREVGQRIRGARKDAGMTQAELGERLARPRSYAAVSDLERGKTCIDLDDLADIAVVLRRDLSWFIPLNHIDALTEQVRVLRLVVEWYADADNWDHDGVAWDGLNDDAGQRARIALAALEGEVGSE